MLLRERFFAFICIQGSNVSRESDKQKSSVPDHLCRTTTGYEPDTLRPEKTIWPNGGYSETEYSDQLITNPSDLLTGFVRRTTTLEANKFAQSYSYFDGRGAAIRSATQTPDGWSIAAVKYDHLGRTRKSFNPFYGTTPTAEIPAGTKYSEVTGIDALGRTTSVKLQDDTTVHSYHNEAAVTVVYPDSTQVVGTVSRAKDQADKERRQIVDSLGRVSRVDEPTGAGLGAADAPTQPTFYRYDGNDNLSKVIQSDGTTTQERRFRYDSLSRLTHERHVEATATLDDAGIKGTPDPATKWTKVLKYNLDGLLAEGIDARGVKTTFGYDGLNRVQSVTYSGETGYQTPTVTYTYDQARSGFFNSGALTRVETAAVGDTPATATEFDYDQMGGVRKHRQWIATQQYDLEYGYNLAGQLTSQKYPSGRTVAMNYDANGRPTTVSDANRSYVTGMQFLGKANSVSQIGFGNGTVQNFTVNDRLQMTGQELKKGANILQKYDYGYGQIDGSGNVDPTKNNGQLARVESHIGAAKQWTQKFSYDSVGRLSESKEQRGDTNAVSYKQNFDFDRFGNLYRKAASNPTSGQENPLPYTPIEDPDISKNTNRFTAGTTYDDAGNVTTDNKFRTMGFSYDANGRMIKATKAAIPDAISVYDAAGLRVAERVNDVWRFLVYDIGGKLIAEYGGSQSIDEGGVKYVSSDWQGSTRTTVSNSGFVSSRMDYSAFGESIGSGTGIRSSQQGFEVTETLRQRYGLTERDDATGLDHTWFRKNENQAGRFTSPDPYNGSANIGDPQSFNRYSYVENDPTNFIDPSGLLMVGPPPRQQSWLEICWLLGMCGNPQPPTTGEEFPGGGGGDPTPPPPSRDDDPCAGKKGSLDYDSKRRRADRNGQWTARGHITDEHVRKDINKDKSKYTNSLRPSIALNSAVFVWVTALNQATFQSATGFSSRGNVAYVYAVPELKGNVMGTEVKAQVTVGTDSENSFKHTNVNTLIVAPDCQTVITSHPGLPEGMSDKDPRIYGTPVWVDRVPTITIQLRPLW